MLFRKEFDFELISKGKEKMTFNAQYKGYSYAILATVAGSTVYIFSKAALNEVSLPQFGVYWFAMAIVWNFLYSLLLPGHWYINHIRRHSLKILLLIGLIELIATATFYGAIYISANPAIPSFLRNMEYIFVTLMGVFLLRERFSIKELTGVVMTFAGAMVISYNKDAAFGYVTQWFNCNQCNKGLTDR